jgi:hypothetical protein
LFTLRAGLNLPTTSSVPRTTQPQTESEHPPETQQEEPQPSQDVEMAEENGNENQEEESQDVEMAEEDESAEQEGEPVEEGERPEDAEEENLPNTTAMTVDDDPAYDMSELPAYTDDQIREFHRPQIQVQLKKFEKRKAQFKIKLNLTLIDEYAEKVGSFRYSITLIFLV